MNKKVNDEFSTEVVGVYDPPIHTMIRFVSKMGITASDYAYMSIQDVDREVSEWVEKGYKLFNTHYLSENPEGYGIMYIFVKG